MDYHVKNESPNCDLEIADLGLIVERGQWAEVPEDDAKELVKQSIWSLVTKDGKPREIPKKWLGEGSEESPEQVEDTKPEGDK